MRKGRDRNQRRSRFDDDQPDATYEAPRQSFRPASRADGEPTGPAIDAIVKWFNPEKGYGFVELADGSGDAFLHIAVLERCGHGTVLPETKLRVQIGQGQKGPRSRRCLSSMQAPRPRLHRGCLRGCRTAGSVMIARQLPSSKAR